MVLSFSRVAMGAAVAFGMMLPADAAPREIATAQGAIAISEPRPGLRAPSCRELTVEARDALDNHIIAEAQPATDSAGACRYTVSVPAQTAVWLRVQPALVAGARAGGAVVKQPAAGRERSSGSVALRFTIVAPTTYFFAPNEQKVVSLSY